jgi:hypothetical protein
VQGYDAAGEAFVTHFFEAGKAHLFRQILNRGKFANGFREIRVGVGRAGEKAADQGENAAGIEVVERGEDGVGRVGEFQDGGHAAGAKEAAHFEEAGAIVCQVAETEGYGDEIERTVAQREVESVGFE